MKIISANTKKISEISDVPDVSDAILGFLRQAKIGIVQKDNIDGYAQEITLWENSMAHVQPMPENMVILKEGNRSWSWFLIYVESQVVLKTDEVIELFGTRYRIMQKGNWAEYGYIQYHAIEDYKEES